MKAYDKAEKMIDSNSAEERLIQVKLDDIKKRFQDCMDENKQWAKADY